MSTTKDLADPIRELVSREHPIGLDRLAFAMNPLGLYRVEPRALLGKKAGHTMRTPLSLSFTLRLWAAIHFLTNLEMCQEALSQTNTSAFLPNSSSRRQLHSRNCVVMTLTGRPSTNRSQLLRPISGR